MYRIYKIAGTISSETASVAPGDNPVYGTPQYNYKGTWGILVAPSTTGAVTMSGGGGVNLAHLVTGTPIPCHPSFVSCSSGTVYILA